MILYFRQALELRGHEPRRIAQPLFNFTPCLVQLNGTLVNFRRLNKQKKYGKPPNPGVVNNLSSHVQDHHLNAKFENDRSVHAQRGYNSTPSECNLRFRVENPVYALWGDENRANR
ncbi:hypothetical protein PM082_002266 [Marasmius tenuissimus]|nr:hypothetical protein PM082_002266 [Marasmius tenuissimus]